MGVGTKSAAQLFGQILAHPLHQFQFTKWNILKVYNNIYYLKYYVLIRTFKYIN